MKPVSLRNPYVTSLNQWVAKPLCSLIAMALASGAALAGPMGEQVVAGKIAVDRPDVNTTIINQGSQKAIINWQGFSIGAKESVNFNQPGRSAVALNRVVTDQQSNILGQLSANGQIFLVNPNGVYFGNGAKVDVGGLMASVMDINDDDFLEGNYKFFKSPEAAFNAKVVNEGSIDAESGGYVVLAGDYVSNTGIVTAEAGTIVLASGSQMTLDIDNTGIVSYAVDEATMSELAGVDNAGQLLADGGQVAMTARVANDLKTTAVNNSGLVQASNMIEKDGEIYLVAEGGDVANTGIVDASGIDGADGGTVEVRSDENITLAAGSEISAKGDAAGNGGEAIVVAEQHLEFEQGASVDVAQGEQGETGGFIELSGHETFLIKGDVNVGHNGGHLLVDPPTVEITDNELLDDGVNILSDGYINEQLQLFTGNTFTIQADNSITTYDDPSHPGSITITDAGNGSTLILDIVDSVNPGGSITLNDLTVDMIGAGSFIAQAGSGTGTVTIGSTTQINAGSIELYGGTLSGGGVIINGTLSAVGIDGVNSSPYIKVGNSDPLSPLYRVYRIDVNNNVGATIQVLGGPPVAGTPEIQFTAGNGGFHHNGGNIVASSDLFSDTFKDASDLSIGGPAGTLAPPNLARIGGSSVYISSDGDVNLNAPFVSLGGSPLNQTVSGLIAAIGGDAYVDIISNNGNINQVGSGTAGPLVLAQGDYFNPGFFADVNLSAPLGSINVLPAATPIYDVFSAETLYPAILADGNDASVSINAGNSVNLNTGSVLGSNWGPEIDAWGFADSSVDITATNGAVNIRGLVESFVVDGFAVSTVNAGGNVSISGPLATVEAWGEAPSATTEVYINSTNGNIFLGSSTTGGAGYIVSGLEDSASTNWGDIYVNAPTGNFVLNRGGVIGFVEALDEPTEVSFFIDTNDVFNLTGMGQGLGADPVLEIFANNILLNAPLGMLSRTDPVGFVENIPTGFILASGTDPSITLDATNNIRVGQSDSNNAPLIGAFGGADLDGIDGSSVSLSAGGLVTVKRAALQQNFFGTTTRRTIVSYAIGDSLASANIDITAGAINTLANAHIEAETYARIVASPFAHSSSVSLNAFDQLNPAYTGPFDINLAGFVLAKADEGDANMYVDAAGDITITREVQAATFGSSGTPWTQLYAQNLTIGDATTPGRVVSRIENITNTGWADIDITTTQDFNLVYGTVVSRGGPSEYLGPDTTGALRPSIVTGEGGGYLTINAGADVSLTADLGLHPTDEKYVGHLVSRGTETVVEVYAVGDILFDGSAIISRAHGTATWDPYSEIILDAGGQITINRPASRFLRDDGVARYVTVFAESSTDFGSASSYLSINAGTINQLSGDIFSSGSGIASGFSGSDILLSASDIGLGGLVLAQSDQNDAYLNISATGNLVISGEAQAATYGSSGNPWTEIDAQNVTIGNSTTPGRVVSRIENDLNTELAQVFIDTLGNFNLVNGSVVARGGPSEFLGPNANGALRPSIVTGEGAGYININAGGDVLLTADLGVHPNNNKYVGHLVSRGTETDTWVTAGGDILLDGSAIIALSHGTATFDPDSFTDIEAFGQITINQPAAQFLADDVARYLPIVASANSSLGNAYSEVDIYSGPINHVSGDILATSTAGSSGFAYSNVYMTAGWSSAGDLIIGPAATVEATGTGGIWQDANTYLWIDSFTMGNNIDIQGTVDANVDNGYAYADVYNYSGGVIDISGTFSATADASVDFSDAYTSVANYGGGDVNISGTLISDTAGTGGASYTYIQSDSGAINITGNVSSTATVGFSNVQIYSGFAGGDITISGQLTSQSGDTLDDSASVDIYSGGNGDLIINTAPIATGGYASIDFFSDVANITAAGAKANATYTGGGYSYINATAPNGSITGTGPFVATSTGSSSLYFDATNTYLDTFSYSLSGNPTTSSATLYPGSSQEILSVTLNGGYSEASFIADAVSIGNATGDLWVNGTVGGGSVPGVTGDTLLLNGMLLNGVAPPGAPNANFAAAGVLDIGNLDMLGSYPHLAMRSNNIILGSINTPNAIDILAQFAPYSPSLTIGLEELSGVSSCGLTPCGLQLSNAAHLSRFTGTTVAIGTTGQTGDVIIGTGGTVDAGTSASQNIFTLTEGTVTGLDLINTTGLVVDLFAVDIAFVPETVVVSDITTTTTTEDSVTTISSVDGASTQEVLNVAPEEWFETATTEPVAETGTEDTTTTTTDEKTDEEEQAAIAQDVTKDSEETSDEVQVATAQIVQEPPAGTVTEVTEKEEMTQCQ